MLLNIVFFTIYIGLFIWLVPTFGFVKRAGLGESAQRGLIVFKLLLAFIAAAYLKMVPNSDHLMFNNLIDEQYRILLHHPGDYFEEIRYQYDTHGTGNLFGATDSFWGYIRHHLVYMFSAPMNFISGGNLYLNAGIFSSFTYFGHLFFLKIFNKLYLHHEWLMAAASFLIPSLLLFTAAVHKDGFVFVGLSIISYLVFRVLQGLPIWKWKYLLACIFAFALIFLLRNYLVLALIPAWVAGWAAKKFPSRKVAAALISYGALVLAFFATGMLHNSSLNLPEAVVKRKQEFATLPGAGSDLPMNKLKPHPASFLKNTPQAVTHVLLRPSPFESSQLPNLLATLESYLYLVLMMLAAWYKRKSWHLLHPYTIYAAVFFITMVLIIGFTIPNMGSIVRYRSLIWIMLLAPALYHIMKNRKGRLKTSAL
jgi:hypothetical protein